MKHKAHITPVHTKQMGDQRIVYGWASVWTVKGEPLVDLHDDIITPAEGEKMASAFMLDYRTGKIMHQGRKVADVIHSLPVTDEICAALGISCDRQGWIIAMKIHSDEIWKEAKAGRFKGFSIGGSWMHRAA